MHHILGSAVGKIFDFIVVVLVLKLNLCPFSLTTFEMGAIHTTT